MWGFTTLLQGVLARSTSTSSLVHGVEHWQCVALTAMKLRELGAEADPAVAFAFALLHDAARLSDHSESGHADEAARLAAVLLEGGDLLTDAQLDLLIEAIEDHDSGLITDDPTIGVCWDADRLNLWRLGIEPNIGMLSQ